MQNSDETSDKVKSNRRRFQFRLRSLLILVAIASVAFWIIADYTPLIRGYVANQSYLYEAVLDEDIPTIQAILSKRPELVDRTWAGYTPLYNAASSGKAEAVKVLIDSGADVNLASIRTRRTPLMSSCGLSGNPDITRMLLRAGANVNATDVDSWTALDHAYDDGVPGAASILLEYKAKTGQELLRARTGRQDRPSITEFP